MLPEGNKKRHQNLTSCNQVSISIGRAAIFLIGGRSKDVEPLPILVRSGDIVIMSGTNRTHSAVPFASRDLPSLGAGESRHCYHGVPRVLSEEEESFCLRRMDSSSGPLQPEMSDAGGISHHGEGLFADSRHYSIIHPFYFYGLGVNEMDRQVLKYLQKARININVRQVVDQDGGWIEKCGTGAMSEKMTPQFKKV
jgi:hypothetical protein